MGSTVGASGASRGAAAGNPSRPDRHRRSRSRSESPCTGSGSRSPVSTNPSLSSTCSDAVFHARTVAARWMAVGRRVVDDHPRRLGREPLTPGRAEELERELGFLRDADAVVDESAVPHGLRRRPELDDEQPRRGHPLVRSDPLLEFGEGRVPVGRDAPVRRHPLVALLPEPTVEGGIIDSPGTQPQPLGAEAVVVVHGSILLREHATTLGPPDGRLGASWHRASCPMAGRGRQAARARNQRTSSRTAGTEETASPWCASRSSNVAR